MPLCKQYLVAASRSYTCAQGGLDTVQLACALPNGSYCVCMTVSAYCECFSAVCTCVRACVGRWCVMWVYANCMHVHACCVRMFGMFACCGIVCTCASFTCVTLPSSDRREQYVKLEWQLDILPMLDNFFLTRNTCFCAWHLYILCSKSLYE